jgi:hypothetical protein
MVPACALLTLVLSAPATAPNPNGLPSSTCAAENLRDARRAFQASYKAKKFGEAVKTLEAAFSPCESVLSPDQRARILSDLAVAAFHSGDKKLCLKLLDRVPGDVSNSSSVAFAIENNRRLCSGTRTDDDPPDCRQTESSDEESMCAAQVLEGARRQLKRVMKAAEDKLGSTAKGSIAAWSKKFQQANRTFLKLVEHDCGPLFTQEFGPWGTGFNGAQSECESSLVKGWVQEIQNRFALPGQVAVESAKQSPCPASNVFDCPAVREVEKKREARLQATLAGKPQTYEESELSASQQIATWRQNTRLHEKLWLAWREAWCVSCLSAESVAREGSESKAQPTDDIAACLVRLTEVVSPPEQSAPDAAKAKPSNVPAPIPTCAALSPSAGLRFDGLYRAAATSKAGEQLPHSNYLRFYADGTVLSASSEGTPQDVARWLDKNHNDNGVGCATTRAGVIQIVRTSPAGKVEYTGKAQGEDLMLHIRSNGHERDENYRFSPVHF